MPTMVSPELYKLLARNWRKIIGNGTNSISEVSCSYSPVQRPLPPTIDAISRRIASEISEANAAGDRTVWNGERFRLVQFTEGRTTYMEQVTLGLSFEASRYSDFLAMREYLNGSDTLDGNHGLMRLHYLAVGDPLDQVMPDLHSDFGVSLLVVTSDGKLVLTKRKNLAVSPGTLHVSVHEGLNRGGDPDFEGGAPSPARAAVRSAWEELNLKLDRTGIDWLLFGHDPSTWEYDLFGVVRWPGKWEDVRAAEALAKNSHMEHTVQAPPVKATPAAVAEMLRTEKHLAGSLLPCLFYALVHLTGDPEGVAAKFETLV